MFSQLINHTKQGKKRIRRKIVKLYRGFQSVAGGTHQGKNVSTSPPSFSCIKLRNPPSPNSAPSSSSSSSTVKFTVKSSQSEGPLRRPVASAPVKPVPPSAAPPPSAPPKKAVDGGVEGKDVITSEFQRQRAKERQEYFKEKKLEEADQGPFFGFIGKNEISNGRWAMFGFAVGMLTEYATGSDFVDQVKILLSNFGILDLE